MRQLAREKKTELTIEKVGGGWKLTTVAGDKSRVVTFPIGQEVDTITLMAEPVKVSDPIIMMATTTMMMVVVVMTMATMVMMMMVAMMQMIYGGGDGDEDDGDDDGCHREDGHDDGDYDDSDGACGNAGGVGIMMTMMIMMMAVSVGKTSPSRVTGRFMVMMVVTCSSLNGRRRCTLNDVFMYDYAGTTHTPLPRRIHHHRHYYHHHHYHHHHHHHTITSN